MAKQKIRDTIVFTFIDLLKENRFDKITVMQLCQAAGISRSSFYNYFDDIFEVIQAIEDAILSSFSQVDITAISKIDAGLVHDYHPDKFKLQPPIGFNEWFDCCDAHRASLQAMLGPHGDPYFEEKFYRSIKRHVNMLMDMDHMPNDDLRDGFNEAMTMTHLLLIKDYLLNKKTTLTRDALSVIINSMRVGGNALGYFGADFVSGVITNRDSSQNSKKD
ncbi:TetR/AcrR family transcriptional regulator [Atopobium fossor]|uniref:TetR/AcrR family transcriptional regulator n=1 Tax=Atopobium fossor TaxID=39487 RepID=UPI0003F948EF|nr:TetR/AcrR family transcriptional regulator [Atopobium fossor]